jgi:hypothetical protein
MTNPDFELDGNKFIRISDQMLIATLGGDGTIMGLSPSEEMYRAALIEIAAEAGRGPLRRVGIVDRVKVVEHVESVNLEQPGFEDLTPRELFDKRLGDFTAAVIQWRIDNWPEDYYAEFYAGRLNQ